MPEITSLSKSSKVQTGFLPLEDLLNAFYEDNARQHSLELDLEDLAMRLLALGWCEHVTYNQKLNRIVDGHGRVLACKWLSERSPDWFALQLKFAQQKGISTTDEERYSPLYWTQVSIIATTLTDDDHAAMNLGLNAEKAFGVDDPDKVSKLLSGLDEEDMAIAGFSDKVKQAIATYADTDPNDNDYQDKQHFERSDATDYSVRDRGDRVKDGDLTEYDEEPEQRFPRVLNLAVTWGDRKKWTEWSRENGTKNDTDTFWQGLKQRFPDDLG